MRDTSPPPLHAATATTAPSYAPCGLHTPPLCAALHRCYNLHTLGVLQPTLRSPMLSPNPPTHPHRHPCCPCLVLLPGDVQLHPGVAREAGRQDHLLTGVRVYEPSLHGVPGMHACMRGVPGMHACVGCLACMHACMGCLAGMHAWGA